jgi:hypothetical protein
VDPAAPLLEIERCVGPPDITGSGIGDDRAQFELLDSGILALEIWRDPLRARFTGAYPPDDQALIHPFLSLAAATSAHWMGWDALHAGGFRVGDLAWAVLGDRGAGKSSTMCDLALRGVDVLTDDLLVIADGDVLAGPNSIDLRPETARELRVGEDLGVVGARERWRVVTPASSPRTPLAGFVSLSWGDDVELVPLSARQRVELLLAGSILGLPSASPHRLLELAALPAWELRRPRRWTALSEAGRLLVNRLG